jgi:sterol desaturase/sphingolipid hydroxylase (fatty acid hydroxylase superfamily)
LAVERVLHDACVPVAAAVMLAIIWAAEGLAPLLERRKDRLRHGARNLALGLFNGGARALVLPPLLLWITLAAAEHRVGLLHAAALPAWVRLLAAIVLLDLWHYLWHVAWHKVPMLWRFHVVHHHDPDVDATTAVRFHTVEILISGAALLAAAPLFGVTLVEIVVFELILVSSAIFHHGNFAIPPRVDAVLRLVIVTPRMHLVHHSRWEPETDSNYSAIFSIWDRLFGTYCMRRDVRDISLGLDGYEVHDTDTLLGMLATPAGPVKSEYGQTPAGVLPETSIASNGGDRQSAAGCAGTSSALATPSTHPSRGRRLPLALAVANHWPHPPTRPSGAGWGCEGAAAWPDMLHR